MKDTIKRNREALGLTTDSIVIGGIDSLNALLPIDTMIRFNKQGVEYIIADGLIVGLE